MNNKNKDLNELKKKYIIKSDKKVKILKINNDDNKSISMEESLKLNQVLLWGLNQVDSIILNKYKDKILKPIKIYKKDTLDTIELNHIEYNPKYNYSYNNLEFLNKEYERIENKLLNEKLIDIEYEKLLDLQEKIYESIENIEFNNPQNSQNSQDSENSSNIQIKNNIIKKKINDKNIEIYNEIEFNSDSESIKIHQKKTKKPKLKPYFWIGCIPDGYKEATQEEAILNKKVFWFGKNKVSRELYNLYDITGTICIDNLNIKDINTKIIALKGKSRYYKKEYEYNTITLNSGKLSENDIIKLKKKMEEINNCYSKTIDVLNFYVKNLENKKNINKSYA